MAPVIQSPANNFLEMVEENAVSILQGCFSDATVDEDGQPYVVQVRAIYSDMEQVLPEITVEIQPGEERPTRAAGRVLVDTANGVDIRQLEFTGSRLILRVRERGDAERRFLLDKLLTTIAAGYVAGPPVIENAVVVAFRQVGIDYHRFGRIEFPPSQQDAARPEGQVFEAILPLLCDVAVTWTTPLLTIPQGSITLARTLS